MTTISSIWLEQRRREYISLFPGVKEYNIYLISRLCRFHKKSKRFSRFARPLLHAFFPGLLPEHRK